MIDEGPSAGGEQATLAAAIPELARAITTGDRDPEVDANANGIAGERGDDFHPPISIHAAVVSTDLGSGGFRIMGCDGNGEDGVLSGGTDMATCATVPPILDLDEGSASELACRVQLGTMGCGYEMPPGDLGPAMDAVVAQMAAAFNACPAP